MTPWKLPREKVTSMSDKHKDSCWIADNLTEDLICNSSLLGGHNIFCFLSCIILPIIIYLILSSSISWVQFSRSVVSYSLRPHESQHTRPPCPSPSPGVHANSHPSSRWCHLAISSSVIPFSSCPQSLPASESFPMSQLFTWGGQVLEFQL